MSKKSSGKNALFNYVKDPELVDFFYLKLKLPELMEHLAALRFTLRPESKDVPFHAQLRGYVEAVDEAGTRWIAKRIEPEERFANRLYQLVYLLDFMLETLSAPVLATEIEGQPYRVTKVLPQAIQIGSYNYLAEPFQRTLARDLINRWLTFDEDRNPNNYMVIYNSQKEPLVVAIDFNHADLETQEMKITGCQDKFGWHRVAKTRFLTLLKPDNFERYTLADFKDRLALCAALDREQWGTTCLRLFTGSVADPADRAALIADNIVTRARYIGEYFDRWFKDKKEAAPDSPYDGLGKSFVDYYKK
jgi:hypothetical protein